MDILKSKFVIWMLENIAWELLVIAFFIFLIYPIKAVILSRKLLINNRPNRHTPTYNPAQKWKLVKYKADRFLDIWFSKNTETVLYQRNVTYPKTFTPQFFPPYTSSIDDLLIQWNLINLNTTNNRLTPVKNITNQFTAFFVRIFLVFVEGDSWGYYK